MIQEAAAAAGRKFKLVILEDGGRGRMCGRDVLLRMGMMRDEVGRRRARMRAR